MKKYHSDVLRLVNSFKFALSDNQFNQLKQAIIDAIDEAYQNGLDDQSEMKFNALIEATAHTKPERGNETMNTPELETANEGRVASNAGLGAYRVHWTMKNQTGHKGFGEPMHYDLAQAWADRGNKQHQDMVHWIQAA